MINFRKLKPGKLICISLIFIAIVMAIYEIVLQNDEDRYIESIASRIVKDAGANDNRSKILALRSYLFDNIDYKTAPVVNRPFLRATAAETLQSGEGYCGEVTRSFIVMADSLGIKAQRINLYGSLLHVVAEAELKPNQRVVVDCQNPPQIQDLEPLDRIILRPEYDDYSTLNVRRLRLSWLVSRIKLEMSPVTYWLENPHAMKAFLWGILAIILIVSWCLIKWLRELSRAILTRRGWVHKTSIYAGN